MQKTKAYSIDLTRISGKGNFECPKCGIVMSPDDLSEEAYTVVEPVMNGDNLEKIILRCNKCGVHISLTGFQVENQA